ncbi:MAG: SGNH/GDSL hydrolase family protein [Chitinophagaceae bacterium]
MKEKTNRRRFLASSAAALVTGFLPIPVLAGKSAQPIYQPNSSAEGLRFLFQGDSITDGNRGRNTDPNHIMGHGYAFAIAARLGADFPLAGNVFYNRGISGNTVADLQKRWQPDTLDLRPDILSVLIGINDAAAVVEHAASAQTTDEFEAFYRTLLRAAKKANPAILFILGLPFVYPVGKRKDQWAAWETATTQRAVRVRKLALEYDALLVDYPALFDKAVTTTPIDYWIWDGIHPTVPGHELMAREWIMRAANKLDFLKRYNELSAGGRE